MRLLIRRLFRVGSLLLHMLLKALLPLGDELSQLGFLVRRENLIRLRSDASVLHFELRVNLRSLVRNCRGLGLIKAAALDELHHLLMALLFLQEQRLQRRLLFCDDLLDLRLLRIAQIKIVREESHHWPAKKITTTVRSARALGYRDSRHQHDPQSYQRHLA